MSLCRQSFIQLRRSFAQNLRVSGSRNIARWVAPTLKELKRRKDKLGPQPENPRSSYLEWNYEAEVFSFGKRLSEEFDRKLLKQALVQREYANMQQFKAKEKGEPVPELSHNFEMIQEGQKIISDYVKSEYEKLYPDDIVQSVHDYLTSIDTLSHVGSAVGLKDLILTNEYPVANETLSNTFEAVVAALKLSQDLNRAQVFVKDFVISQMNGKDVYEIWDPKDPYGYLTRLLVQKGITEIEPRICNQSAVNTIMANFQIGLYINKKLLGIGWGESIQIAKETAAIDAIQRIYKDYKRK